MKQMMRLVALAIMLVAILPAALRAQDFTDKDTLRYVDAMNYRLINWAFDRTLASRIPLNFKDSVRPTLWDRAYCTSGKGFRFATNRLEGHGRILGVGNGDPMYLGEDHPKEKGCHMFSIPAFNGSIYNY